jgi:hypothetical protein
MPEKNFIATRMVVVVNTNTVPAAGRLTVSVFARASDRT